jgi:ketosteroid isomerase-like protein
MTEETALLAANAAYYEAFSARDIESMAALWAPDGVSCIHPGWPPLIGRLAVLSSYGDIFRNPRQEAIQRRNETVLLERGEGRVYCIESVGGAALVATNWFRRTEEGWLLVHHQASPLAVVAPEPRSKGTMH